MATYLLFIQHFFDLKKNFPRFNRWVNVTYWLLPGYAGLYALWLAAVESSMVVVSLLKLTLAPPVLYVMFFIYKRQNRLFNLILSGTLLLVLGGLTSAAVLFFIKMHAYPDAETMEAVRDANTYMVYLHLGIIAEIFLFTTALGYKSLLSEKEKNQALLEAAESRRLQELDQVKNKLYTNITHEFRTPLTVILGIAEKLTGQVPHVAREGLALVKRNGSHLLDLVNQMLDLAKLESGSLPLHMIQGNVVLFLKYLLESFHSLAESKNVTLHFYSEQEAFFMDYDREKLRQIISNLISNAIKFTPSGGNIYLELRTDARPGEVEILIRDTGRGISEEQLEHIFERFFQADDASTHRGEGSGIGLTLTKELVKLLEGSITVASPDPRSGGKGTAFSILLPVTRTAELEALLPESLSVGPFLPTGIVDTSPLGREKPLVLIVEDNTDVAHYLTACLRNVYRLQFAENGKDGVAKAFDVIPDLIVSDVMMPEMDGFELCRRLKTDVRTSHVPIVLLTAKADTASKIEGLEHGADDYLAKPFHEQELKTRLKNLLNIRRQLQERYRSPNFLAGSDKIAAAPTPEDAFLLQFKSIVEERLSDPALDVGYFEKRLGMSRTKLHRKLTALTGMSLTGYVRHIRLTKARQLLQNYPGLTVSEVAYQVGFASPGYFTRRFIEGFGVSPSE